MRDSGYVSLPGVKFFFCLGTFPYMQRKYCSISSPCPCWTHCGACRTAAPIVRVYHEFFLLSSQKPLIFFPSELLLVAGFKLPEVPGLGDGVRVIIGELHCGGLLLGS